MQTDPATLEIVPGELLGIKIVLLALSCMVASAAPIPSWEQIGELRINQTHTAWTSPESLVRDLRSQDKAVRLKALRLVGTDTDKEELFADAGPDEIELRYASLGGGPTRQAIIMVEAFSYAYAAIAVPSAAAWDRVAVFECWCKYENTLLDDFVRVEYTHHGIPDLLIRASGGGTGLYEQTEARFALQGGELRKVLSFISRRQDCPIGADKCLYVHRWFRSGQLVEAKAAFESGINIDWDLADARVVKSVVCTAYKWNAASFMYVRASTPQSCKHPHPE